MLRPSLLMIIVMAQKKLFLVRILGVLSSLIPSYLISLLVNAQETPQVKISEAGNIKVEVSYQEKESLIENPQLKIFREGQILLEQPLQVNLMNPKTNQVEEVVQSFLGEPEPQIIDLDQDQEPEIILLMSTPGSRCCSHSLIYQYEPTQQTYTYIQQDWGSFGSAGKLIDINQDSRLEFIAIDDRFSGEFAGYAGSFHPIQIWHYQAGTMIDVTRQFPDVIYKHVYTLWSTYEKVKQQKNSRLIQSILAAYLADKYLLGQQEDGWQRVKQAYQENDREEYFYRLRQLLKDTGYMQD
jgi:hypothetical protein